MRPFLQTLALSVVFFCVAISLAAPAARGQGRAATIVVAPHDASPHVKASADLVAGGARDEEVLRRSVETAGVWRELMVDSSPADQTTARALSGFSVRWLPGTYVLDAPLELPDMADAVLDAEGATFNFRPTEGDAVTLSGGYRNRLRFGVIVSASSGSALAIRPTAAMPMLMSEISFTGLVGQAGIGQGLTLDGRRQNITTNRISGTDVAGFGACVAVRPPEPPPGAPPGFGKVDTNHFWFSYIRRCRVGIDVSAPQGRVDSNFWTVNVDASLPNSIAIRTAASFDRWRVMMGTWGENGMALVVQPGARHNLFDVTPPLDAFPYVNDSGNNTNFLLDAGKGSPLPPVANLNAAPARIVLVESSVGPQGRYNIVQIDARYAALAQDLGPVDLALERLGDRDLSPWIFTGDSTEALREKVAAAGKNVGDYRFVALNDRMAAVLGGVPIHVIGQERIGQRSLPPLIITGSSPEAVKAALAGEKP